MSLPAALSAGIEAVDPAARIGTTTAASIRDGAELRVGLTVNVLGPPGAGGPLDGIGVYTRRLREGLARQPGVTAIDVRRPTLRRPWRPAGEGVAFGLPWPVEAGMAAVHRRPFIAAGAVERAIEVLHVTDYHVPQLRRTPVIATLYDAIPLRDPSFASRRFRSAKNALLRTAAGWADGVIAISEAAVPELVEHFRVDPARIRVVPLGVEPEWAVAPSADEVAQTLGRYRLRPGFVITVGTLQPRKNVDGLLRAHRSLPLTMRREHPLVVVGRYGWSSNDLVRELRTDDAADTCRWLGYVSRRELRALYAAAAVFVFPSFAEGFGLPLLEAMAAGTPAIASDLPVMRELGGEDVRYVVPSSTDAIAEALRDVIADRSAVLARVSAARRRAEAYTWANCVERTLAVYREWMGVR